MKIPVEKANKIEDGLHEGVIKEVQYREKPYKYTDLIIEFDEGMQLKVGYPTKVYEDSKLGMLLKKFGIIVALGQEVDPDDLVGKRCSFQTMADPKNDKFSRILPDSVKPAPAQVGATPETTPQPKTSIIIDADKIE